MSALLLLAGLLLFAAALDRAFRAWWHRGLSLSVAFGAPTAFEGGQAQIVETVENRKMLPLPIVRATFEIDRSLAFEGQENVSVSDRCYKQDVFSLLFYQRVTRTIALTCTRRGFYRVERADLIVSAPLLEREHARTFPQRTALCVYPRAVDAARLEAPFRRLTGEMRVRRFVLEDPFAFRGIREYAPGDAMNAVNWKTSARVGSLMVNQRDTTASQSALVLLNVEDDTAWYDEEIHEEAIRVAAGLCLRLLDAGASVGLCSNGRDLETGEATDVRPGIGARQRALLLTALARIDLKLQAAPFEALMRAKALDGRDNPPMYVLVSKSQRPPVREAFWDMDGALMVVPLRADGALVPAPRGGFDVMRWEVAS